MSAVLDLIAAVLVVLGAVLALTAAIGLIRLPDVLSRMHAATKPQTVGLLLVVAGAALALRSSVDVWMLVLTGAFQLITAPVTAHMVGRLAHRTGGVREDLLHGDDLARDIAAHGGPDRDDVPRDDRGWWPSESGAAGADLDSRR